MYTFKFKICVCVVLQARIKKIMQTDEDVGKVAAAVPVLICILLNDTRKKLLYHACIYLYVWKIYELINIFILRVIEE